MKYWKLNWTSWTNYYIPVNLEIPILSDENSSVDHGNIQLTYYPINCLILGRAGDPWAGTDLDLFMLGVEIIHPFMANLEREELKEHPWNPDPKDIISWIIRGYKNKNLIEQLKLSKPIIHIPPPVSTKEKGETRKP